MGLLTISLISLPWSQPRSFTWLWFDMRFKGSCTSTPLKWKSLVVLASWEQQKVLAFFSPKKHRYIIRVHGVPYQRGRSKWCVSRGRMRYTMTLRTILTHCTVSCLQENATSPNHSTGNSAICELFPCFGILPTTKPNIAGNRTLVVIKLWLTLP